MKLSFAALTDTGLVRQNNEDCFLVVDLASTTAVTPPPLGRQGTAAPDGLGVLLAVADGMGGALAGEVASRLAMDVLREAVGKIASQATDDETRERIREAIVDANRRIHQQSQANPRQRGMGTTLTAAFVQGGRIRFFQVGDSKGFLARKGKLHQMTKDHSLIGRLVDDKVISEKDAEQLEGGRNIILQALGAEASVKIDYSEAGLGAGDVVVLCTDGLHGCVRRQEIEERIAATPDCGKLCEDLVGLARDRGGSDNITVLAAVVQEGPPPETEPGILGRVLGKLRKK